MICPAPAIQSTYTISEHLFILPPLPPTRSLSYKDLFRARLNEPVNGTCVEVLWTGSVTLSSPQIYTGRLWFKCSVMERFTERGQDDNGRGGIRDRAVARVSYLNWVGWDEWTGKGRLRRCHDKGNESGPLSVGDRVELYVLDASNVSYAWLETQVADVKGDKDLEGGAEGGGTYSVQINDTTHIWVNRDSLRLIA
jgi:hypothetical protein